MVEVHRCRFVDWVPPAIESIAFAPSSSSSTKMVAVALASGEIAIWSNIPVSSSTRTRTWFQSRIIPGVARGVARCVCWASQTRLFSAGLDGRLVEWNLGTLTPTRATDSYGGAIWGVSVSHDASTIAIVCDDGAVRLFSLYFDETPVLDLKKSFLRKHGKLLCVAWNLDDSVVYAAGGEGNIIGSKRGKILKQNTGIITGWDTKSGSCVLSVNTEALIWTMQLLRGGTLVTGDSQGCVRFWDSMMGTLEQEFKEHQADVLAIAANREGTVVFAAGVDNKVGLFHYIQTASREHKWVFRGGVRRHTHDIKALALRGDTLMSGGVDTQLYSYSVKGFSTGSALFKLSPFPHLSLVSLAANPRLLLAQSQTELNLWRLGFAYPPVQPLTEMKTESLLSIQKDHKHLLKLNLKASSTITSSCISPDGTLLFCSDNSTPRLFSVSILEDRVDLKKISMPPGLPPAHRITFSHDSTCLFYAAFGSKIFVLRIIDSTAEIATTFSNHCSSSSSSHTDWVLAPVTEVAVSENGRWLATGDLNNTIHIFDLTTLRHYATPPVYGTQHTALAIRGDTLIVVCADRHIYLWDIVERGLSEFSRKNPNACLNPNPGDDKVIGIIFPRESNALVLFSQSWLCYLDLDQPFGTTNLRADKSRQQLVAAGFTFKTDEAPMEIDEATGKEKGKDISQSSKDPKAKKPKQYIPVSCCYIFRFRPILFAGFMSGGELVVVQRPWLNVLKHFPEPLARTRGKT